MGSKGAAKGNSDVVYTKFDISEDWNTYVEILKHLAEVTSGCDCPVHRKLTSKAMNPRNLGAILKAGLKYVRRKAGAFLSWLDHLVFDPVLEYHPHSNAHIHGYGMVAMEYGM